MMSFGWRGVRDWGRTGGGAKDWAAFMVDSAMAISECLAARSVTVRASGLVAHTGGTLVQLHSCCIHDVHTDVQISTVWCIFVFWFIVGVTIIISMCKLLYCAFRHLFSCVGT
jgi:hypothetical protein